MNLLPITHQDTKSKGRRRLQPEELYHLVFDEIVSTSAINQDHH